MMRRTALLTVFLLPALSACERGVPVEEAVADISEADFLAKISVIADDSMLGRANPSPGLDMTAQWVADQFKEYGLEPGGDDGTYIQHLTMKELGADFEGSSAQVAGGPALDFGTDITYMRPSGGGSVTAPSVLVSGTASANDEFPADEVRGKHVFLVLPSAQAGSRRIRYPSGLTRAEPASLIIVDNSSDEDWATLVTQAGEQRTRLAPWAEADGGTPTLRIRQGSLEALLAAQGMNLAQATSSGALAVRQLPDLEIALATGMREMGSYTLPNTVGILEGSDPELKNEYVLYSAHMDHVGVGRPDESGDSIRNGADDDASGTISVVEVAESFSMLADKPRRSIIFLGVAGEEAGLLGSRYFAENPSVPIEQIVADLNSDMISRNATDTIVAIGKEHSDLGETLNRVNGQHPELNLTAIDDIWPEENFYRRSDHFNFARRGVPVLFFFCGTTEHYHQASDEVDTIDITKATNTTKLLFYMGLELANADQRPQWNAESRAEIVDMGG